MDEVFERLKRSKFRSRFYLSDRDKAYLREKGYSKIKEHAYDFVLSRLAPKVILNDGKQTPFKGHPVFIAQHATGCCCRGCLFKWHGILKNKELSDFEVDYVVSVIMEFLVRDFKN